jgi:RNA polymerase sigma-70 factor (ECF subfamily)
MASRRFQTTRWSLVLAAGDEASPAADAALAALCGQYWSAVYAFVRARGHDADAAADLTQAFFARLLEKRVLHAVRPERGRFRSFLLTAVQHFLANEHDRARTQKRGGDREQVSVDVEDAEARYRLAARADLSPDAIFERDWALALLERAMTALEREYRDAGKAETFARLRGFVTGDAPAGSQRAIGADLGMSEGAVSVALHRLRRRYGEALREEIAQTVDREEDVADEIRYLLAVLARSRS